MCVCVSLSRTEIDVEYLYLIFNTLNQRLSLEPIVFQLAGLLPCLSGKLLHPRSMGARDLNSVPACTASPLPTESSSQTP